jgi:hypothetical protein
MVLGPEPVNRDGLRRLPRKTSQEAILVRAKGAGHAGAGTCAARFYHAAQDIDLPWAGSAEVARSLLHERMTVGNWTVWHPPVPKAGLGSITDDGL